MKKELDTDEISKLVSRLKQRGAVIYLESQLKGHPSSRKSYIAGLPESWIKAEAGYIKVFENEKILKPADNPWKALREFRRKQDDWLFGYLGYDLKNSIEDLRSENEDYIKAPDLFFLKPAFLAEIDGNGKLTMLKGDFPELTELNADEEEAEISLQKKIKKEEYLEAIRHAQEDIYEGEYYEINLSHPLFFDFKGNSWQLYKKMKEAGPVPFGGYFSFDEYSICCSSPERFLAKKGEKVWSQPIKGTASREKGDPGQVQRLQNSIKEQAENLMIVDLVRNDLSHFAKNGTVRVKDLFEVQSFETVHQMVSTVECEVSEDTDCVDLIRDCFPMGSMTGAPKIAAMKAIEKLENYRRGIYSGAMGYFNPAGNFDFNVMIRSALIKNTRLVYPVGGAITSDSVPEEEWEETLVKARAITNVIKDEIS